MGKNYIESVKLVDKNALYSPAEAMELVVKTAKAKFDETIDLAVRLVDQDMHQRVKNGVLPHGTDKAV